MTGGAGVLSSLRVVARSTRAHPSSSHCTPQIPSSSVNIKAPPPRFKVACQQSATSHIQGHLHFRSQRLPIAHCIASHCMSNIMHSLPRTF